MSDIKRSFALTDVLEISKTALPENSLNMTLNLKEVLRGYCKDPLQLNDRMTVERILNQMSSDLQMEESLLTSLLTMKFSQSQILLGNQNNLDVNNKVAHDNKSVKYTEELTDRTLKCQEDFHLTPEMSRKLLDHQFLTRQKMISSQLEKTLYEMPLKRPQLQIDNEFIPTLHSQEFVAMVGFNRIVDILKDDQLKSDCDGVERKIQLSSVCVCVHCGTDASPFWKRRKTDEKGEETFCNICCEKIIQSQNRKDFEDQISKIKLQFEEQEKNLIRDYNDMLSSPKKMEMFRQEQEKRHRIQRMKIQTSATAATKQSMNSGNIFQNIKSSNSNSKLTLPVLNLSNSVTRLPARNSSHTKESTNAAESAQSNSYHQFLQAFSSHVENCSQQQIDQENLQKLEQILALAQTNPTFANNNLAVLQLISTLANLPADNVASGNNNNNNVSCNTKLTNLLSYFVNLMQTQGNQNNIQ